MAAWSVEADALGHQFTDRWVFSNLTFQLPAGSRVALTGSNGSGKSTLGRVLAGHLVPTAGTSRWNGSSDHTRVPLETLLVGTGAALPGHLTGHEALRFHAAFRHVPAPDAILARWKEAGLSRFLDVPLRTLSTGMRARMHLGLAWGTEAALVVLDEPAANLDARGKAWYRGLLDDWAGRATVVVCTNALEEECPGAGVHVHLDDWALM